MSTRNRRSFVFILIAAAMLYAVPDASAGKDRWLNSPLSASAQSSLDRAAKYLKRKKPAKAKPYIASALATANDLPKCFAIASFTEPFGYPMMQARRDCITKALSLCSNSNDYMQVALKARRYQFFEITREAIHRLLAGARTRDQLYDLARKCQEVALNDVAHMAMQKAYKGVGSVDDALVYAKEVKYLGMDDLLRRVMKDLIDDENDAHQLCLLFGDLEPMGMKDLNRYLLKKALDVAKTVDQFKEIYECARRCHETDIFKLAAYRGKKLILLNQIKKDREAYQSQVQEWREGVRSQQDDKYGGKKTFGEGFSQADESGF